MRLYAYFSKFERVPTVPILGYNALKPVDLKALECLLDPEKHLSLVKFLQNKLKIDAALPLLDLTVEAQSMGAKVVFADYDAPKIEGAIGMDNVGQDKSENRMLAMIKTAEKMEDEISNIPTGFYVTGPFTAAGQIIGIGNLVKNMIRSPDAVLSLLERVTATCFSYAKELEDAGIDFLVIADPSSSLISAEQFKKFSQPYLRRITSGLKLDSVLHVCGRSSHLIRDMPDAGVEAVSIDHNVPLKKAVQEVPNNILVLGNYPPSNLVFEDVSTIRKNVYRMLMDVKASRNVVSSTGCDIPSNVPMRNVEAFVEASKEIKR